MTQGARCAAARPPRRGRAACGERGWLLHAPLRAGPVTADMRRNFESRLRATLRDQAERDARALHAAFGDVIRDLCPSAASATIAGLPCGVPKLV
jgi:hypothetical protein